VKVNRLEVEKRTVSISEYLNNLKEPFRQRLFEAKQNYRLDKESAGKIGEYANTHFMVAFSGDWCKDCAPVIAALALINEAAGIEVRVFGGLKKDVLSYSFKWRIPPSPPEVNTFGVDNIPLVLVFNDKGEQIGRIVEKPKHMPTIEQELVEILKRSTLPSTGTD
jgi:hypothetical protein